MPSPLTPCSARGHRHWLELPSAGALSLDFFSAALSVELVVRFWPPRPPPRPPNLPLVPPPRPPPFFWPPRPPPLVLAAPALSAALNQQSSLLWPFLPQLKHSPSNFFFSAFAEPC